MSEKYVVRLKNAAIYHADNPFGSTSAEKLMRRGEMVLSDVNLCVAPGEFVYLIGRVGSGKSTLLNRLLNEERVLVSDIAGTTRDVIEERINIDGVVFRFLDTAGIRATDDRLEQMGIQRTMSSIERAQIVIYMTDAARLAAGAPVAPEFPLRADQKLLVLVNKRIWHRTAPCPKARSAFRPATATA